MALEQAYWNQRQATGSWTGGFIYATGSPPPTRKSTELCLLHAYSSTMHCDPIMPTSPMDLLVTVFVMSELEEKDTEGEEKDKVQLDDLTDRVIIVWLT